MESSSEVLMLTVGGTDPPSEIEERTTPLHLLLQSSSLIIIMTGAIIFNLLTVIIILRVHGLRKNHHNMLILNLSVADLGVALTSMTFSLVSVFDGGHFLKTHDMICKMNGFFSIMFSFTNLPLILSIAIDRLLIVVFCRRFPPNRRRIYVMITASWLVGLLLALAGAAGLLIDYAYDHTTKHCTRIWENDVFRIICSTLYLGLTLPGLIVIYVIITFFIRREGLNLRGHQTPLSVSQMTSQSNKLARSLDKSVESFTDPGSRPKISQSFAGEEDPGTSEAMRGHESTLDKKATGRHRCQRHEAHKRVILMGALLVFTTLICWAPYFLFHSNFFRVADGHWLGVFTMWLGYCNALIDPLIYAFLNRRVRSEMLKMKQRVLTRCSFK